MQSLSPAMGAVGEMALARLRARRNLKDVFDRLSFKTIRSSVRRRRELERACEKLARFPRHPDAPLHCLPGKLVVSLTSYPGRYSTLHLTLKSLLDQKVRPDRLVLWVAHEHLEQLPRAVTELKAERFEIRGFEDIRSFKKIVPALQSFPDAFILICDDDTYYPEDWLKRLVEAYDPGQPTIVCHRAHQVAYTADGRLAPYFSWRRSVSGVHTHRPRTDLLATGNGGVLYPPGSLPLHATDLDLIRELSPTCDDSWLHFMWRSAGWTIKRVPGPKCRFVEWPGSQTGSLHHFHLGGGRKDEHLRALSDRFGVP